MTKYFDYCILGAGLAGVSLAYELSKENASVCLIDPNGIASGASGTPLGLVNPATGRYATLSWEAENCYSATLKNLTQVQQKSRIQFFKKSGVLRPALDEKIASRMKENFSTTNWPSNWIEWLDEPDLKEFHKGINCIGGGVWLPIGLTVNIPLFLSEFVSFLNSRKVTTSFGLDYSMHKKDQLWEINLSNNEKLIAKKIIFTTGSSTKKTNLWKDIPLHSVKGQLAVLEASSPLQFNHAVSALGYIASLDGRKFVIGSTYEHSFEHEEMDKTGLEYLLARFGKVLPELKRNSKVISQWSGVRVSTPNRMPIMGQHPLEENIFLLSGLGSKGLLYSAFLSRIMTSYLIGNNLIPKELDIERFK
ncbi:MAG: FAD-dependent oxidoreductase [Balneolaceae bacterium]